MKMLVASLVLSAAAITHAAAQQPNVAKTPPDMSGSY